MSQENLDLVRSILASWQRGDFSSDEWADPAIAYEQPDGLSPGSWTGLTEMAETWRGFLSSWEDLRIEVDEYRELDGERVLVLNHFSGSGKASGVDVGSTRARSASLFELRGGRVVRLVQYWDQERAFADLGLDARPR